MVCGLFYVHSISRVELEGEGGRVELVVNELTVVFIALLEALLLFLSTDSEFGTTCEQRGNDCLVLTSLVFSLTSISSRGSAAFSL